MPVFKTGAINHSAISPLLHTTLRSEGCAFVHQFTAGLVSRAVQLLVQQPHSSQHAAR